MQWYWTYNLPSPKAIKSILGGWAADGMLNFATGQPYTVSYLFETLGGGDFNGSGEYSKT